VKPPRGVVQKEPPRLIIKKMESNLKNIKKVFIHRLVGKGIEPCLIPGLVRILANSLSIHPHINLQQVNMRLRYLGCYDVELDYHTLSLAVACFEEEGFHNSRYIPPAHSNTFIPAPI